MKTCKNMLIAGALALNWAAPLFAGPALYGEAAAPWSAEQAAKLPPAITADFLKEVKKDFGTAAADGLAEKKNRVSALLNKFKDCSLNRADLDKTEKYFTPGFKAELRYFAGRGCAEFRESAVGKAPAARSASLGAIEAGAASGALNTREGAARFFDGAVHGAGAAPVTGGGPVYSADNMAAKAAVSALPSKRLAANVPAPRAEAPAPGKIKIKAPANIGEDGRVHQAVNHWNEMRENNWEIAKNPGKGSERVKALLKAGAASAFEGLLIYSNLSAVEKGGARVRWDAKHGAAAGTIAGDSAKLAFNSAVFFLAFAPIPFLKVAKAALAGEAWAIAMMGAMSAGSVNRYIVHVPD
ncbi:MAG: hypothetical protein PHV36_08935 [Elusimicrobiales bacterium]|nr:hypothetical protein [Elusimicrobiales bacterium]